MVPYNGTLYGYNGTLYYKVMVIMVTLYGNGYNGIVVMVMVIMVIRYYNGYITIPYKVTI